MSGGIDSTAAYLLTRDALHENYGKRPVMVTWDTGVGLPLNRLYLEELADTYNEQLVTWRTNQSLERYVDENDCPGAGAHEDVRKLLKGQQSSKLTSLADFPVFVLGLRAQESDHRAALSKVSVKRRQDSGKIRHVEVYPAHRLTKKECARIILEHEECPINPCWLYNHATDCFCLANGDPSELDATAERFPWFAQRVREIEEAADPDGLRGTLGWDGLAAIDKKAKRNGQEQARLTTCGQGCQRQREPAVAQAFRARIHGATKHEAISILDEIPNTQNGAIA
jgi:3'-phosphoadenosine 5'-phosphosulfate sulfotransferase (PAPS reductase)/FAD synthetase